MSSHAAEESPRCSECGAAYRTGAKQCWLCGAELTDNPFAAPATVSAIAGPNAFTFSLASLFMVMTLVAVGFGVFAAAPGLGFLFAVLATPALVRTIAVTSHKKAHGLAQALDQKILAFLGSVGVVLLVLLSIGIALLTACLTACAGLALGGEKGVTSGMLVGGVAGLVLTIWLLRLIWRWQRKEYS